MKIGRSSLLILAFAAGLMLSACEDMAMRGGAALLSTDALGIFRDEDVNLTQKNYAAADYIIQQARTFVKVDDDLIEAKTLVDAEEPRIYSALGRVIPEQVGIRLSQLGYRVDLSEVSTAEDPNYLKPVVGAGEKADFVLSGSYVRKPQELEVSLRITDAATGRIVGVFDYVMPMNRELAKLAEPETRIIKLSE